MDIHSHKCQTCSHVWTHDRPVGVSEEAYEAAHTCPKGCGTVQYWRHEAGDDAPWIQAKRKELEALEKRLEKMDDDELLYELFKAVTHRHTTR